MDSFIHWAWWHTILYFQQAGKKAEGSGIEGQTGLHSKVQARPISIYMRFCLKIKNKSLKVNIQGISGS